MRLTSITSAASESGKVGGYITPARFAVDEITFAHDVSARQESFDPSLTPYLMPVLEQWDFRGKGHREIVVMGVEQTGKSLSWMTGLIWSFEHEPCLSMVVYPSDDKCDEVNRSKLQPIMRSVPRLAAGLAAPMSKAKNRYNFQTFISYFQGAVERISAHSARIRIADEVDDWLQVEGKEESPKLEDLRKRGRTFDDSMLAIVSSPKGNSPIIAPEFKKTSQGYWHLRCKGCGELTMRSADVHHLQFETTGDGGKEPKQAVPGSERLTCPACKHEHVYADAREMNMGGGYVHKVPELVGKRTGFQWGALASQWGSLDWTYIAEKQLAASSRGLVRDQANFDNSIRGLPFRPRRIDAPAVVAIESHRGPLPAVDDIEAVLFAADTQDDCFMWIARAVLKNESTALVGHGKAATITDLDAALRAEYMGVTPLLGIIDEGGHRAKEVQAFVFERAGLLSYKGNPRIGKRWTISRENAKLLLAMPSTYQAELLYYVYTQDDREKAYWYLPENIDMEYIKQLAAVHENARIRGGDQYENWQATGPDHFFDCEKMFLALVDYAKANIPAKHWRSGSPAWMPKAKPPKLKPRRHGSTGGWLSR